MLRRQKVSFIFPFPIESKHFSCYICHFFDSVLIQFNLEYIEDSCRIPKNTYLIITRVPLALQTNGEQMDANNRKNAKHQANDINPRK